MSHVFVIAEAGISHDGDLRKALTLIDRAREAKADAVKFQTFNSKALCKRRGKPELDLVLKPYEMPLQWLPILKDHCDKVGIEFMTTCFDEETLDIVDPLVKRFKIGHGESGDIKFIRAHCGRGKQIIASFPPGVGRPASISISPLRCSPKYPTPISDASLQLPPGWGYSDHTGDVMMGALAVAAGAKIVEVHFNDWYTNHDNPDRCVSHGPTGLLHYIELIRRAELAVYGADSEETKKLERPGSAPRTSRPPESGASALSGDLPAA